MNNLATSSKSKQNDVSEDEIFEDSTFLANFDNSFSKKTENDQDNLNNDSLNTSALNVSALCCDEEISGYDKLTGETWIYPTNYPVRDYQFNIIKTAILKNTLVSLPTGLGKTFIAAVVMYNFYRWYPLGKIVFTAPTRPLVAQQIDACYNIIAIPPNDTIEMTGHMQVNTRKTHWQKKRVFFTTPQVVYNDLKSGICPGDKIRCLVIDEAHRARRNYAYCQIVSALDDIGHKIYRVLALSATPGSKVDDVVNVVKSLHIAHLELRTEDCIDVAPYSHSRKIHTVVIQLGEELSQLRQHYVEIIDHYARRLKEMNILPQHLGNLSKGRIVMMYKEYQSRERGSRHPQHNYIMKDFTILIALYHGFELLVKHGSRVFLNFFDEHPEKSWIQSDDKLTALLERLRDDLGINPLSLNTSLLPDGTIPEVQGKLCFGHPKFYKLKEIMMEHFSTAERKGQDTRAIVFCEYRESVNLVHCLLLQCRPLIKPQMFVGQGASGKDGKTVVSQKQQLRVMRSFREGACNTLVATCVAEEGLDVGSVDLIICFDISTRSPIRLVQRCGRTGRERGGQVYILVTDGREHQTLIDCMRQRDGLNKKIMQSQEIKNNVYKMNPRMMPHGFTPQCRKMHINIANKNNVKDKDNTITEKKGQKNLRSMFQGMASSSNTNAKQDYKGHMITENEFKTLYPNGYNDTNYLENPKEYWNMRKGFLQNVIEECSQLKMSTWLEWQRTLHKTINIHHSKDTEILSELLQYSDAKRFEMTQATQKLALQSKDLKIENIQTSSPIKCKTSSPIKSKTLSPIKSNKSSPMKSKRSSPLKSKQSKKKQKIPINSPVKKDGDIRALFSIATKSTKNFTKLVADLRIPTDGSVPTSLINLLVDITIDNRKKPKCCVCENLCDCSVFKKIQFSENKPKFPLTFLNMLKLPNIDLIDEISKDTLLLCKKSNDITLVSNVNKNILDNVNNCTNNFDLIFDFGSPFSTESPRAVTEIEKQDSNLSNNFDIGGIDDIFADDTPQKCRKEEIKPKEDVKKALDFFGLDSIEDIFADSDDDFGKHSQDEEKLKKNNLNSLHEFNDNKINCHMTDLLNDTIKEANIDSQDRLLSPSILSGRVKQRDSPKSSILSSQSSTIHPKHTSKNCTSLDKVKKTLPIESSKDDDINIIKNGLIDTNNQSMFTITQLVEMINRTQNDKSERNELNYEQNGEIDNKERSISPILLTQSLKKKMPQGNKQFNRSPTKYRENCSLIILESDSDSNETHVHDFKNEINSNSNKNETIYKNDDYFKETADSVQNETYGNTEMPTSNKRKLEISDGVTIQSSPYFSKRQKVENSQNNKPVTLQEKVLAAITSQKINIFGNNHTTLNFDVSQPNVICLKENQSPKILNRTLSNNDELGIKNKQGLEMLQKFKRDVNRKSLKHTSINFRESPRKKDSSYASENKITFGDSDDNFIFDDVNYMNPQRSISSSKSATIIKKINSKVTFGDIDDDFTIDDINYQTQRRSISDSESASSNHKARKKKTMANKFLDLEAELSEGSDSGDELSQNSVGSIADFICDDNVTGHEDMHALYLKSVRSPVKQGGFKIPQLPTIYNKADILSQNVDEDSYVMDSFCVDSHIGLTQVNEISDLELAEIALEEERRERKGKHSRKSQDEKQKGDSPLLKRKTNIKRQIIHSDSDDSS